VVGQGTFGEVWSAVERHTRESVAVKILEKDKITDDDARQRLVNEIAILQRVQHSNLVQLLEVIDEADRIYLVTEYVGGGELFAHIVQKGRLDEKEASKLFAQMVAAVDSCHRQFVIHRDLKPENVLLDASGDIKVIDFGLGTLLNYSDEVLTVACGSPHYAAPEMLLGGGYLGQRADMWSLGVCLYAMVCGYLPFDEPEMEDLYDRIIAGEYEFSDSLNLSQPCKELIAGLLHSPPEERLTAREVLNHRWMRKHSANVPTGPLALSVGIGTAIVDPACRELVRKMQAEYGLPQRGARCDRRVGNRALRRPHARTAHARCALSRRVQRRRATPVLAACPTGAPFGLFHACLCVAVCVSVCRGDRGAAPWRALAAHGHLLATAPARTAQGLDPALCGALATPAAAARADTAPAARARAHPRRRRQAARRHSRSAATHLRQLPHGALELGCSGGGSECEWQPGGRRRRQQGGGARRQHA
jgi:5'-AMP-activated protein kinase catalytic alpha subunit